MAEPSRFLMEIPADLMTGPLLARATGAPGRRTSIRPTTSAWSSAGARRASGRRSGRTGAPSARGVGGPAAPRAGEAFRPTRDLAARREAFAERSTLGDLRQGLPGLGRRGGSRRRRSDGRRSAGREPRRPAKPAFVARPVIPGERRYRDGDRVRHARWGDGIVVTSKLTRSDEEVTVAFRDSQVGRKTVLASLAGARHRRVAAR